MNLSKDNLKAIFFDFDDVLANSLTIKEEAFMTLFESCTQQEKSAIQDHFNQYTGRSRQEKLTFIYKHILNQPLPEQKLQKLCEQFKHRSLKAVIASPEITGTSALLNAIPNNILCFVVSGTPEIELQHIVRERGIARYFAEIKGTPTPKENNIAQLLEDFQLPPKHCLMLGDGLVDKQAADLNNIAFKGIVAKGKTSPFPAQTAIYPDLNTIAQCLGL